MRLRAATRGSALARWQTDHVAQLLVTEHGGDVDVEVVIVDTEGDRRRDVPIEAIGGRGVFVKEVQAAVLEGRADFAVHSAKDLPSAPDLQPEGLLLAAVPEREDPRDCLVGCPLETLPVGALVATGSVRRRAQLAHLRPDLGFAGLRGNVDTRLAKAPDFDAIVLAYAALKRLGRADAAAEVLPPAVLLPQVAQGALAVECRTGEGNVVAALSAVEHRQSRRAVDAERAFLATLGGACDLPVGALALVHDDEVRLEVLVASYDGARLIRRTERGRDAVAVGRAAAAAVMDAGGAMSLLPAGGTWW